MYVVPFAASIVAALALSAIVPPAATWPVAIIRLIMIAVFSTVVLYAVDRGTRRLLPLAVLLDLTLVFPDEAPSRFKIALRAGGTHQLQERLVEYRQLGADEPARAAELLLGLVAELSRHDRLTRGHSERVRAYAQMIGEELGLDEPEIDRLRWAALLHDVGKLEVPAEILNKPGKLTFEEYEIVKQHPNAGAALAEPLAAWLGESVRAVAEHHERWDGGGYPNGLEREQISLSARIVAVADTFDVMTSVRSYQEAGSPINARQEITDCAGSQFDPAVVRAFLSISLGKLRMAMGPLSWLTQLSLFPPGLVSATAAPAMTAVAGIAAATIGITAAPADYGPVDPPGYVVTAESIDPLWPATVALTTTTVELNAPAAVDGPLVVPAVRSTPTESASPTQPSASAPNEAGDLPAAGSTTTIAQAAASTTLAAQTTSTTPSRSTAAATTTVATTLSAPTTTTTTPVVPTTTTPVVPTTTTSTPQLKYFLAAVAAGDVNSSPVLPLVTRGALNATLPNLDVNHDDQPGHQLKRDGQFTELEKEQWLQRFQLDAAGSITLDGRAELVLYAAPKDLRSDEVVAAAALVECPNGAGACIVFESVALTFVGDVGRFSTLTFDFGAQSRTIAATSHLELWITAPKLSKRDLWVAYDTVGYESALNLNL